MWDLGLERMHRKDLGRRAKGTPDGGLACAKGPCVQGSENCTLWLDTLRRNDLERQLGLGRLFSGGNEKPSSPGGIRCQT